MKKTSLLLLTMVLIMSTALFGQNESELNHFPGGENVEFTIDGKAVKAIKTGDDSYVLNGDMVYTLEQIEALMNPDLKSASYNGITLWADGIIYYTISSDLPDTDRVYDAIDHIEENTNIRFVARSSESNYIEFQYSSDGTYAHVGAGSGKRGVWLADWATYGNCVHELGHSLGLLHEHCRSDRDDYITVLWDNISDDWVSSYTIISTSNNYGTLDFGSIMIYGAGTAMTKLDGSTWSGQRTALSTNDKGLINNLYPSSSSTGAPVGSTIVIKANSNDNYLSADLDLGTIGPVYAKSTSAGSSEQFTVVSGSGDQVRFLSVETGSYLRVNINDGSLIDAAGGTGTWTPYTWIDNSDGTFSLQAGINSNYVCADISLTDARLVADRTALGSWEKFTYEIVSSDLQSDISEDVVVADIAQEIDADEAFMVYPNPASSTLSIKGMEGINSIVVYAITGKEVIAKVIDESDVKDELNIESLNNGLYMIKATGQNTTYTKTFVKN